MPHRTARIALLVAFAGCSAGCFTHRCRVPAPVVEAAPGPRLPGAVQVRYAPPGVSSRSEEVFRGVIPPHHRVLVDADPPTRALFDRLAASLFEGTAAPADAVLEVQLRRFDVGQAVGATVSSVGYHVTLRRGDETELASFDVDGVASVRPRLQPLFCGARGDAVAAAMQDAGGQLVRGLSGSAAVAAWLAGRGAAPVAFRVKPADAYGPPTATPSATATPRPVDPGPPPTPVPPRALRLRAGVASFRPRATGGRLEQPSRGLSVTPFAAEVRVAPGLRVDVDLDYDTRSYSASGVPHLTGFGPRATLDGFTTGVGLRVSPPLGTDRPLLEPWIGASARLVYTKLAVGYFGGASGGDATDTAWSAGADLGGGVTLFLAAPWFLGLDVRWRVGRARLAPVGSVDVGGLLLGVSLGGAMP